MDKVDELLNFFYDFDKALLGESVIAGGFVRDYLLDKDIADLDIFYYPHNPHRFRAHDAGDYVTLARYTFKVLGAEVYPTDPNNAICCVLEKGWNGHKVNVIVLDKEKAGPFHEYVGNFHASLSQVYLTAEGTLRYTPAFKYSATYKTNTFAEDASYVYRKKIGEKYFDYLHNDKGVPF